jgi:hypothetical protein
MRLGTVTAWVLSVLISGAGRLPAEPAPTAATKPLRIVATLLDGSMLSGTPATNVLPIDATFARFALDMRQVQAVEFKESGVATAALKGGDKVSGKVGCAELVMTTAAGTIRVPVTSLQSLDMLSGIVPVDLRKGLVAHIGFNDEASFGSNAGDWDGKAAASGATCIPDGFAGGACRFEPGKHEVRLAHAPEFASPTFSLIMWLRGGKALPAARSHQEQYIVSKRAQDRNAGFWVTLRQRQVYFSVGGPQQNYNTIAAPGPASDDWWMLAATYDGRTIRLIGASGLLASTEWTYYGAQDTDLLLGASGYNDEGRSNWSGDLDEFLFFNRALSVEEVAQIAATAGKGRRFTGTVPVPAAGPMRVIAELNEGSKIKGEVDPMNLSVHNVLVGALDVRFSAVRGIRFASGTNEVVMTLAAGDLIKGTLDLAPLKVKALFGGITIPAAVISVLSVGESPADLPAVRSAGGGAARAATPADVRVVRALIEQLKRGGQKEREKAVSELAQIGEAALLPLREALKDADADAKWWLEAAIQQIQDRAWTK